MLPKKRFDQARPFLTLGLVLAAWAVVPVAVKSFARASFFEFQAPFGLGASRVRDLQDYWSLRLHSQDELIAAGRDLGRLTASYENTVRENAALRAENDRIRELTRVAGFANFRAEIARVSRRDFSGWWQRLEIRKGRIHGIVVDAPVIFAGGLVGRVTEVHAYTSVVDLVSSPTFRLAAVFEGDDRAISYQGSVAVSFKPPEGVVELVPVDIAASGTDPRLVVTSGMGGIFPPGLAIGQVISLTRSTDGLYTGGKVYLDPRLSALREVTVLIPDPAPAAAAGP